MLLFRYCNSTFLAVFVFRPQSSELVNWKQNISKYPAISAAFIPRLKRSDSSAPWNEQSSLIYISKDQVIMTSENYMLL